MKTKILLLAMLYALPLTSEARLAMPSDFPFVLSDSNTEIFVNDDGSYETVSSISFKVLREEAKAQLGLYKLQFDSSVEDMSVIEAYVENGSDKILVDKANIQKSAIAVKPGGIVNNTEIAIPFSQIKVASIVSLKLQIKNKKGPFGKYFSENIYWGDQLPEKGSISVRSSTPLFYKTNDPFKVLSISNEKEKDGKYWLRASLANQFSYIAIQELGAISKNEHTSLSISNMEKWQDVRKIINAKYEPVLNEKLSSELEKIIKTIPEKARFDEKISILLEYITSNYDYLGDWRKKGKYIPKLASKISTDRFGDCKDFATLLIKMLRSVKIKADYALVERSYDPLIISEEYVPTLDYFNHVIVRVQNDENVYWIDPTNNFSVGLENRYDISDRNAFVLGDSPQIIQPIQKTNKDVKSFTTKKIYGFLNENEAVVDGVITLEGETSRMLKDSYKDKTDNEYQDALKAMSSQNEKTVFTNFNIVNSKKDSYSDIDLHFTYRATSLNQKEDKLDAINVLNLPNSMVVEAFRNSKVSDVGTINIAMIPTVETKTYYKNIFLSGKSPIGCDLKSDWVNATRKFELLPDGIVVNDYIKFKKEKLSRVDFQDVGFSTIATDLTRCFLGNTINYDFGTNKHIDRNSNFENSIVNLTPAIKLAKRREIAGEIMDNRSVAKTKESLSLEDAKMLLEKNLAENPYEHESLRMMAAYYRNNALIVGSDFEINSMKRALEYADKALSIDPNYKLGILEKIVILLSLKQTEEARKLFYSKVFYFDKAQLTYLEARKILDILYDFNEVKPAQEYFEIALKASKTNKEKSFLYSRRASYHMNTNNDQLCVDNYIWAIKLDNSRAWSHGNLSICYNELKKYDEAIQSAKNAIKIYDYGAAHFYLSTAYVGKAKLEIKKRNYKEAEVLLQQAALEGPGVEVYVQLAYIYLWMGQEEKARAMAKKTFEYEDRKYTAERINFLFTKMFKGKGLVY